MRNPLLKVPAPRILRKQVLDSAPWIADRLNDEINPKPTRPLAAWAKYDTGWWSILAAANGWQRLKTGDENEHLDYFSLCLACHHASVATFVPTDVDSKIRDHLWRFASSPGLLRKMSKMCLHMRDWELDGCSNRHLYLATPNGRQRVSGHDGEHLSVLIGGIGKLLQMKLDDEAEALAAAVEQEIQREADLWHGDLTPVERGKMAMILAHNGGDIDQGLGAWKDHPKLNEWKARWGRLVKDNEDDDRYGGAYREAVNLYRKGLSAEAHRHYPLRAIPQLRRARDLCLPFPPFLAQWGTTIAQHAQLTSEDVEEICCLLVEACDRVPGQRAYQRAIRGILAGVSDQQRFLANLPPTVNERITKGDLSAAIQQSDDDLLAEINLI